jgi:hypothetical protein
MPESALKMTQKNRVFWRGNSGFEKFSALSDKYLMKALRHWAR